jgi:CheY-like chemotaxis protein/HPt (histidine-containing phosphotransfer) domain-containing protein
MGMSNQLSKTPLTERQQFYLQVIHSASDNLLVIINDILDLSKVEAGKLSLENIGFRPKDVVGRAMQVLAHKAEEKGLRLSNSLFAPGISPVLTGDPYRLNQVLLNLVGNAIKFTETGYVDVSFSLLSETETTQTVKIAVKDSGIGMDASFVKHLFEEFSQANESITRKYGGTGLGMSISRNLVELMGGKITAESEKGRGTTITLLIEFKKGEEGDLPEHHQIQFKADFLAGKRIMVTDDNEMNRLVASIILQNYGAAVVEAVNGMQALELLKNETVDLVLMDMQMPVMNGTEATKLLRQRGCGIPIVALTAEAIKGEREKCLALGMNDYITKPIKEEEFLEVIGRLLHQQPNYTTVNPIKMEEKQESLFDLGQLEQISRGNNSFVVKMTTMFCEITPPLVREMIAAYNAHDLEKMGSIAHKIKPSLDNLNIGSLKEVIRDIELAGRENREPAGLPGWLDRTETVLARVVEQMKERYLNLN